MDTQICQIVLVYLVYALEGNWSYLQCLLSMIWFVKQEYRGSRKGQRGNDLWGPLVGSRLWNEGVPVGVPLKKGVLGHFFLFFTHEMTNFPIKETGANPLHPWIRHWTLPLFTNKDIGIFLHQLGAITIQRSIGSDLGPILHQVRNQFILSDNI